LARLGPPEGGQIVGKRRQFVGNEEIAFPHQQKQNAREEIAFPDCGRQAKEESRNGLLRVSHRRPSWQKLGAIQVMDVCFSNL